MTKSWMKYAAAANLLAAACALYAADQAVITIQSPNLFPESITSTKDGAIIIGSYGTNSIWRIPAGKNEAAKWIDASQTKGALLGVLAEAVHLLLGARSLTRAKQSLGLVPVLPPVAARSDALPKLATAPARRFSLALPELVIHAAAFTAPAVVKKKSFPQLTVGDLVVDSARSPGETEHALLSAGEILTAHRLGALAELPAAQGQAVSVAVVEAPEASRVFLRLGA